MATKKKKRVAGRKPRSMTRCRTLMSPSDLHPQVFGVRIQGTAESDRSGQTNLTDISKSGWRVSGPKEPHSLTH